MMKIKMPRNNFIIIRVTRNQHDRIKNNASAKGYKTISAYLRSLALEHDLSFNRKFDHLYNTFLIAL